MKKNLKWLCFVLTFGVSVFCWQTFAQEGTGSDLANLKKQNSELTKAYDIISVQDAWNVINEKNPLITPVIIGVIDTGVEASHQEFSGILSGNSIIGKVDFTSDSEKTDNDGHGTHVVGIIGANNLSGNGILLEPTSPQMNGVLSGSAKIRYSFDVSKKPFLFSMGKTIDVLAKNGVTIINQSAGTRQPQFSENPITRIFFPFVNYILRNTLTSYENKILFVFGAGNDGENVSNFSPASFGELPNVIAVGGTNNIDTRLNLSSVQSNFGEAVSISAPGEKVYSPSLAGKGDFPATGSNAKNYTTNFSGTSASAPLVTGVAGLLKSIKPSLTPSDIKNILIRTADPIQTGETDKRLGKGCYTNPDDPVNTGCRLNAYKAVCDSQVGLSCVQETGTVQGYTRRGMNCEPPNPPVEPNLQVVAYTYSENTDTWTQVAEMTSDSTGFYHFDLPPGIYYIGDGDPVIIQAGETVNHDAVQCLVVPT
jgi:subtilisin family serine protease